MAGAGMLSLTSSQRLSVACVTVHSAIIHQVVKLEAISVMIIIVAKEDTKPLVSEYSDYDEVDQVWH